MTVGWNGLVTGPKVRLGRGLEETEQNPEQSNNSHGRSQRKKQCGERKDEYPYWKEQSKLSSGFLALLYYILFLFYHCYFYQMCKMTRTYIIMWLANFDEVECGAPLGLHLVGVIHL